VTVLRDQKASPGKVGFNQAKLAVLAGPRCDHANDSVRLRYFLGSGGTTLWLDLGECVRGGALLFSMQV
jgi:hypothetical protein